MGGDSFFYDVFAIFDDYLWQYLVFLVILLRAGRGVALMATMHTTYFLTRRKRFVFGL